MNRASGKDGLPRRPRRERHRRAFGDIVELRRTIALDFAELGDRALSML